MGDFDHLSDQIQDELVDEYLKKNPDVSRSEVVPRLVNGKVVIGTIKNFLTTFSAQKSSERNRELAKMQIKVKDDERYKACKLSIKNCKKVVDFLFTARFGNFSLLDKNTHMKFIRKREQSIIMLAHDILGVKQELLQMMSGTKPAISTRSKELIKQYYQAVVDQLKCQHGIYTREHELGSRFTEQSRVYMKEHMKSVKSKLGPAMKKRMAQAYVLAKKMTDEEAAEPTKFDREMLEAVMAEMDGGLKKRRVQIQAIEKLVEFLEKLIEEMEKPEKPAGSQPEKPKAKKKEKKSGGMAFISKLFGK